MYFRSWMSSIILSISFKRVFLVHNLSFYCFSKFTQILLFNFGILIGPLPSTVKCNNLWTFWSQTTLCETYESRIIKKSPQPIIFIPISRCWYLVIYIFNQTRFYFECSKWLRGNRWFFRKSTTWKIFKRFQKWKWVLEGNCTHKIKPALQWWYLAIYKIYQ